MFDPDDDLLFPGPEPAPRKQPPYLRPEDVPEDLLVRDLPWPPEGSKSWTEEQWATYERLKSEAVQAEKRRAEAGAAKRRRKDLFGAGVPRKDLDLVLGDDMDPSKALEAAQEARRDAVTLLVLSGPPGCGKTTAASWWLSQEGGWPVLFVDASRLSRWPRFDEKRMEELEWAKALVVDDLGLEYDDKGGAFRSFLDGLVNARYADLLPTLITTNLTPAAFKERYGARVADRIREAGRFVSINEPSRRKKGAAKSPVPDLPGRRSRSSEPDRAAEILAMAQELEEQGE